MDEVRGVLFDADGVVQRATPGWQARLEALVAPERAAEFLAEVMLAERGPVRGEGSFPEELAKVLSRCNVAVPVEEVLANWTRIEVFADVVGVIGELRGRGIGCYLATNQQAFRTAYMRASLGYDEVFDDTFYSCELRVAKPDPAYFTAILERIGRSGAETLFLDDNQSNVDGARAAGLHAEHFLPNAGAGMLRTLLAGYSL